MPLILTSIERIENISTAMELRGFGTNRKRTWYSSRPFSRNDYIALIIFALIAISSTVITFYDGSRFYNIFD